MRFKPMRHALRKGLVPALVAITSLAASPRKGWSQEPPDELTPRALADSTYAVRVALDALAESIRHGGLHRRQLDDPELASAVARLAAAAARRARRGAGPDLGVVWDLRMEVTDFQPVSQEILRVRVRVFLATLGDSTSAPATLTFRQHGDRWELVEHEGLTQRLADMALRLPGGTGR
jgi:hypothetical protein